MPINPTDRPTAEDAITEMVGVFAKRGTAAKKIRGISIVVTYMPNELEPNRVMIDALHQYEAVTGQAAPALAVRALEQEIGALLGAALHNAQTGPRC